MSAKQTWSAAVCLATLLAAGCSTPATPEKEEVPTTGTLRMGLNAACVINTTFSIDVYIDNIYKGTVQRGNFLTIVVSLGNHQYRPTYNFTDRASYPGAEVTITVPAGTSTFNTIC